MGLRRLPKKSTQTLSADTDTPVYMTFCYIVVGVVTLLLANDLSVISAIAGLGVFVIAVIAILPVRRLTHPAD